jgi:hypothetical protein
MIVTTKKWMEEIGNYKVMDGRNLLPYVASFQEVPSLMLSGPEIN